MAHVTKVTLALSVKAQQHQESPNRLLPKDQLQSTRFRDKAKQRFPVLAQLGPAVQKAGNRTGKSHYMEIPVIEHAVVLPKPLAEQLLAARQRTTVIADKLHR